MKRLKTSDLVEKYKCVLAPSASTATLDTEFVGVAPLLYAKPSEISFLTNERYFNDALQSKAGAILCSAKNAEFLADKVSAQLLTCDEPYVTFARISQFYFEPMHHFEGHSSQAHIDKTAVIDESAVIFPFAFVGPGARVGKKTVLYPGVFVGAGSTVGADCILYPNSVVREGCKLGDRCILNPAAVIGGDGFGFAPSGMENVKIPQVGGVRIGDDVELGANASVDRGTLADTVVGKQTKIDNLVQIAHNVQVGEACFIAAQSGVAGSTQIGNRVTLAGQVGVVGHISIADGVTLLAQSGVSKSITKPGSVYFGSPALPNRDWLKMQATLQRIVKKYHEPSESKGNKP